MSAPTFAQLFKKYRLRSEFESLREFTDALAGEGMIYDESLFSHWQKGSRVPKDRNLLLNVIKLFIKRRGISSLSIADKFLQSVGQGYLTKEEIREMPVDELTDSSRYNGISKYLWHHDKTLLIETTAKSVWVATPDFHWDTKDYFWPKVILENIIKGATYFYLYKNTRETKINLNFFAEKIQRSIGDKWKKRVHFIGINSDQFPWYIEHVLYDPFDLNNEHLIIIDPMGNRETVDGYYTEFNVEFIETWRLVFREQFKRIWNKKVKDPSWKIS